MIFLISQQNHMLCPHLNRLNETVQIRGHNICFHAELTKLSLIIAKYSLLSIAPEPGLIETCFNIVCQLNIEKTQSLMIRQTERCTELFKFSSVWKMMYNK